MSTIHAGGRKLAVTAVAGLALAACDVGESRPGGDEGSDGPAGSRAACGDLRPGGV